MNTQKFKTVLIIIGLNLFTCNSLVAQLPDPGFEIDKRTAIVITDPQNDFLSKDGIAWGLVGPSVEKNNTIENIETLFKLGEKYNIPVFISPHLLYDHDHKWQFNGAMLEFAKSVNLLKKNHPTQENVSTGNSGADIYKLYKKYIDKGNVTITSPHKVFGPESNDLVLQLRKQKIDKVILAGMLSNLCTESHLRELVEQGFEVAVVKDATAAAILPNIDGYEIALANFSLISSHVFTTKEIKKAFSNTKL
ncbi:MAG: isochorismatase [Flavobacterium sp. MedPE-SWcel]|uniref:isochorismatase family protein n=1 Tax=uncultured Flavobacterium sp. TaxID=165435 RepID=UPI000917D043|nr:isochorismatase family protein [uncultured Flavobacterium sp.]OIQ22508.1 MAG: isochorismatase [Flavobacterium sp. MedPE-SWcel]